MPTGDIDAAPDELEPEKLEALAALLDVAPEIEAGATIEEAGLPETLEALAAPRDMAPEIEAGATIEEAGLPETLGGTLTAPGLAALAAEPPICVESLQPARVVAMVSSPKT